MSASSRLKAKVVRVHVKEGRTGLFFATSHELKGLLVAEPTLDQLDAAIANAIRDLYRACGMDVVVTKLEDEHEDGTPWVAFPASVAKAALEATN